MYEDFRLIHLRAPADSVDKLLDLSECPDILDWTMEPKNDGQRVVTMLVGSARRQDVLDRIQRVMPKEGNWRILIQPLEAAIPKPQGPEDFQEERARAKRIQSREELYNDITSGLTIDSNFLALVILSSIVAAIGMLKDNVSVVIGAMVIAPLLGSNLAFIFAAGLGDRKLIVSAAKTAATGAGLSILIGVAIGLLWPFNPESGELMSRTHVGADSVALALASGAAAALSVSTGIASALVGVMVAVALLPPAMATGIMLGAGEIELALGAALLLTVNLVAVNLAGQSVFLIQGLKPRTWYERKSAAQSVRISIIVWVVALTLLSIAIWLRNTI